jgi:16S rRNA (guanine527-N7)-methyltransferase
MEAAALRELLAPYVPANELDDRLIACVQGHLELLLRWNQKMNLTAVRTEEEMVRRHFGESLFAARRLVGRDAKIEAFDVGSGAGFPGLPLKYWAPGLRVSLIEGHGKKATFLREVGRALALEGLTVINSRAEAVSARAELVTLRAVEKFEAVLPAALGLVAPGGRLALLIGEGQRAAAEALLPVGTVEVFETPASERRIVLVFHVEH